MMLAHYLMTPYYHHLLLLAVGLLLNIHFSIIKSLIYRKHVNYTINTITQFHASNQRTKPREIIMTFHIREIHRYAHMLYVCMCVVVVVCNRTNTVTPILHAREIVELYGIRK